MKNRRLKSKLLKMKLPVESVVSEGDRHIIVCDGLTHWCLSERGKEKDSGCYCANQGRYE